MQRKGCNGVSIGGFCLQCISPPILKEPIRRPQIHLKSLFLLEKLCIFAFTALKAPNISDIPDVTVFQNTQGGDVELHCDVTGNPEPSITWYFSKDGKKEIKEINRGKDDLDGDKDKCKSRIQGYYFLQPGNPRVLVICDPEFENHEGQYWCHANNTEGRQNMSAFVTVNSK